MARKSSVIDSESYATTYTEFRRYRPLSPRERIRYVALEFLAAIQRPVEPGAGSVDFLAFHYLFEDNEQQFRQLLTVLSEQYNFISVSEAVNSIATGNLEGRNICFTCDDGFKSCLKAGEILKEFGATCCFFICPEFIEMRGYQDVSFFNNDRLGGPAIEFMTWNDIDSLLIKGHEIGNHTKNHKNLGVITETEVEDQIGESLSSLKEKVGTIDHFACPYGQTSAYTRQAVDFCYSLGHKSFFTTSRATHTNSSPPSDGLYGRQHFEPFWPVAHSKYFLLRP